MWNQIKGEPVLFQGVIQAALAFVVAFGGKISPLEIGSILALTAAILSWITRSQVTPLANPKTSEGTPLVVEGRRAA